MFEVLKKLFGKSKLAGLALIFGLFLSNVLEGIGISLAIPVFQRILGNSSTDTLSQFFDSIYNKLGVPFEIAWILTGLVLAFTLKAVLVLLIKMTSVRMAGQFLHETQRNLFCQMLGSRLEFFLREKQGYLMNAMVSESGKAANAYVSAAQWMSGILAVLLYLGLAIRLSGPLAILAAAIGFCCLWPLKWIVSRALIYSRGTTKASEAISILLSEALSGVKIIKGSAHEDQINRIFDHATDDYRRVWEKAVYNSNLTPIFAQPIAVALLGLILWLGTHWGISFAEILVFLLVFQRMLPTIATVQNTKNEFNSYLGSFEKIREVQTKAESLQERKDGIPAPLFRSCIKFEHVDFTYSNGHRVFSDLNLTLTAGHSLALLGPSGCGKTTLVDLVMGFYHPDRGRILLDGQDLSHMSLSSWRAQISYVPQDVFLFHDTIASNIAWGDPDVARGEIEAAARMAHAHEFIVKLEKGYETVVGDRGGRLSGGQRQRLALARALLRKPQLLILDEATSALDSESEKFIAQTLRELRARGDLTILMIAHRLTTVRHADQIFVLRDGRILGQGKWEELSSQGLVSSTDN